MTHPTPRIPTLPAAAMTVMTLLAACAASALVGCGGGDDGEAMPMRPVEPQARQATAGQSTPRPAEVPDEAMPESSFITVVDADQTATTYEFPPAKLFLADAEAAGDGGRRARATLFSDDPAEALSRDGLAHSFHFEMDLALPDDVGAGQAVSMDDLAYADWQFRGDATAPSGARSGVYLATAAGGERHLQPEATLVEFDPLGDGLVIVTLVGDFAEFPDGAAGTDATPAAPAVRRVSVRAVLTAEALRR